MKRSRNLIRLLFSAWVVLSVASHLSANDNTQPIFGSSLTIHGASYDWVSAYDDGTFRFDTMTSGGHSVTLQSRLGYALATVSGSSAAGTVSGHVFGGGSYQDNSVNLTQSGSFPMNGQTYTSRTTVVSYSVDLWSNVVTSAGGDTYSGPSGSYVSSWGANGESSWNQVVSLSGTRSTPFSASSHPLFGRTYAFVSQAYTESSSSGAASDGSSWSISDYTWTDSFTSGDGGSLTISQTGHSEYSSASGSTSSSTTSVSASAPGGLNYSTTYEGSYNGLGSVPSPASGHYAIGVFGGTYYWQSQSQYWTDSDNYEWFDYFSGQSGGAATLHHRTWTQDASYYDEFGSWITASSILSENSISGWDPYIGSFSWSGPGSAGFPFGSITANPRTDPSFAPRQLHANGQLATWVSGSLASDGVITDTYTFAGGNVVIQAPLRSFAQGTTTASVSVNGSNVGTYSIAGGFVMNSSGTWNVEVAPVIRTTPFFLSSTSIWVGNTQYQFTHGYNALSARSDTYVNASAGTVTLSGVATASNQASVQASYLGLSESGSWTSGVFTMPNLTISGSAPAQGTPVPALGSNAYWLRGNFYQRTSPEANSFEDALGHAFTLGSTNGGATLILSGSDARGNFSGSVASAHIGLFVIQDAQGAATVPAVTANSSGTLQLSATAAPGGYPPALMVADGRIWVYLGTGPDEAAPSLSAAYYGSASDADSSPWLIALRADGSGNANYIDAATGQRHSGTYSVQSHLFQTSGPQSGFPMPIFAVDPTDNNRPWELPQASGGLPDAFLVDGELWRYRGLDGNGVPQYQGYYDGQILSVGAPDSDGLRVVTVTDPIGGVTLGTLNDARGSVRLRDGRVAYSAGYEGQRLNPVLNPNGLETIVGDLDITGNVLSLGSLTGASSTAGLAWQFIDDGATATLHNGLARSQARWLWSRKDAESEMITMPVLEIQSHGPSTLHGSLRVRPGGDIPMGSFTASPQGMSQP